MRMDIKIEEGIAKRSTHGVALGKIQGILHYPRGNGMSDQRAAWRILWFAHVSLLIRSTDKIKDVIGKAAVRHVNEEPAAIRR